MVGGLPTGYTWYLEGSDAQSLLRSEFRDLRYAVMDVRDGKEADDLIWPLPLRSEGLAFKCRALKTFK